MNATNVGRARRMGWASTVLGLAALVLIAWTPGAARASQPADSPRRIVIGMVAKSSVNPVYIAARSGAEAAARKLSGENGYEIEIVWRSPFSDDAARQAQLVGELVAAGVDALAVSASDPTVLTPAIDRAVAGGVQVVTFDADAPESMRMAYYGINDRQAGATVLRELSEAMPDGGRVAMLVGNRAAENIRNRVIGAAYEAREHDDIELVGIFDHAETPTAANAAMRLAHERYGPIDGWALMGGWPLYDSAGLDGVPAGTKIVSMDPLPPALDYLDQGRVELLIAQPYYGWGYESVRLIFDRIANGVRPEQRVVTAPLETVDSTNAAEYREQWLGWVGSPSQLGTQRVRP
jgi:ribose transport system substrate-binding protein